MRHSIDRPFDQSAVLGSSRRGLGLADEPDVGERGRKFIRSQAIGARDHADAIRGEHLTQQTGYQGNQAGLVDHVGAEDDRMLLVGQVSPVEMAYRKPHIIKPIFGCTACDEIKGAGS